MSHIDINHLLLVKIDRAKRTYSKHNSRPIMDGFFFMTEEELDNETFIISTISRDVTCGVWL